MTGTSNTPPPGGIQAPSNDTPPGQQTEVQGIVLVLITSLIWGTTGTVQTLGPDGIDPLVVGAFRIMIGGMLIYLRSRIMGQRSTTTWSSGDTIPGAVFVVAFQLAFFTAIQRTGVVVATVTTIGTTPVFTGLFARIYLGERLRRSWYPATAISIVGVVLLTGDIASESVDSTGLVLAILAATAYAAQTIMIRKLVQRHPPEMVMARLFLIASMLVVPILFLRPLTWLWSVHGVGTVLYLGIVATTVAYVLFSRGLRTVGGAVAGTVSLAEPAAASLFGFMLLGERLPLQGALGILCIAIALVMVTATAVRGRVSPGHIPVSGHGQEWS